MSSPDTETDSDELDPDEPRTPMWLPLLGSGLFLLALLLFLATRTDEEPVDEISADPAAEQAPAADAEQAAPTEQDPTEQAQAPTAPARRDAAPAPARAERAAADPAGANDAPARGDTRNRAPNDPHFGHDHD